MKENPFYNNYIFKKEDINRITNITWQEKFALWFKPLLIQRGIDGNNCIETKYKKYQNRIYIIETKTFLL